MTQGWGQPLKQLAQKIQSAVDNGGAGAYRGLNANLSTLRHELREMIQAMSAAKITPIIKKIKNGTSLNEDEIALVRSWTVGNADAYTKHENNFQDWVGEALRIKGEIERLSSQPLDIDNSTLLKALIRDLERTIADIAYFLEEKERVGRFDNGIKNLTPGTRKILAGALEEQLRSPEC